MNEFTPNQEPTPLEDLGKKYRYFMFKDLPARKLPMSPFPDVYRPGKGWVTLHYTSEFTLLSVPCDEARVREMIAELEHKGTADGLAKGGEK